MHPKRPGGIHQLLRKLIQQRLQTSTRLWKRQERPGGFSSVDQRVSLWSIPRYSADSSSIFQLLYLSASGIPVMGGF